MQNDDTGELFRVPEQAILAFEQLSGLLVTVHDLVGSLWPFIQPERFQHRHPLCQAMKASAYEHACMDFDAHRLHLEIFDYPSGRVQICYAGLVECIMPVFHGQVVQCILYAGPRRPSSRLLQVVRDHAPTPRHLPWSSTINLPNEIDDDEARMLLESLHQLAARLSLWYCDVERLKARKNTTGRDDHPDANTELFSRRLLIRTFIQRHHTSNIGLSDLAIWLQLSEGRAGHVVKEACGSTFTELLTEARLSTAAALLRHSNLSVLEVARRSGYEDISHFHRCFRRHLHVTPLQYRKTLRQDSENGLAL